MSTAFHLVILLSVGHFQATLPGITPQASPRFTDDAQGARDFTSWAKATMPTPKFMQPPLRICVVGAVPFTPEAPPYLPKPLWESTFPLRALEPYSATFHYVELPKPASGAAPSRQAVKSPKPRTMKQAQSLCAEAAKQPPPAIVLPSAPASPPVRKQP